MDRIIDGRGTGKTRKLMEKAKEHSGIVVCANPEAMRSKAERYGIVGLQFISYNEFYKTMLSNNLNFHPKDDSENKYYIDELEMFVQCFFKTNGYTLTNED